MFTFVLQKPDRRFAVSAAVIAAAVAAGIVLTVLLCHKSSDTISFNGKRVSLHAENEGELSAFAREIGLDVSEGITLEREITIPESFDDVYNSYNELQKSIGLDLYPYRGKKAKLYRCSIGRYGEMESAIAAFIICNGRIIGGDISDEEAGGEMRALI